MNDNYNSDAIIVLIQIPILRKKFKRQRLLQIPVSTVFGLMIDLTSLCIEGIAAPIMGCSGRIAL